MELGLSGDGHGIVDWWNGARGEAVMPRRRDLHLDRIPRFLSRLTVLDVVSPTQMIFRLTGTSIDHRAGLNPRGVNVLDITPEADRDLRARRFWHMARTPCIGLVRFNNGIMQQPSPTIVGVTLPVLPDRDGEPIQLFTLLNELNRPLTGPRTDEASTISMPDGFAYVDIGQGAPTDDTGDVVALADIFEPSSAAAEAG